MFESHNCMFESRNCMFESHNCLILILADITPHNFLQNNFKICMYIVVRRIYQPLLPMYTAGFDFLYFNLSYIIN